MSKFFIFFASFLFFQLPSFTTLAQDSSKIVHKSSKWFIKVGMGYSLRSGIGADREARESSDSSTVYNYMPFSYGKGFNISFALGTMLSDNFGFDLAVSYHLGGKIKTNNRFYYHPDKYYIDQIVYARANMFRFNPALLVKANPGNITPYARLGVIFVSATAYADIEETAHIPGNPANGKFEWKFSGGWGSGYTSAIGITVKTKEPGVSWFFELSHVSLGTSFQKGSKTKHTINNSNQLSQLTVSQKEVIYVDKIKDPASTNPDLPTEFLKRKSNANGIGINFGLWVNI